MSYSVVALIPARAGSKRIEGKNKRDLAGWPLIAYTIQAAKDAGIFKNIVVSTDDEEIIGLSWRMDVDVSVRNDEHAADTSPDIDWVADLLARPAWVDHLGPFDAFSILRPTSPFRSAATIRKAWEQFTSWCEYAAYQYDISIDSLRAVAPSTQHPCKAWRPRAYADGMVMQPNCDCTDYGKPFDPPHHSSPTQCLRPMYAQTVGLEIAWTKTVTEQHSISGERVMPFLLDFPESIDLNTETDFLFAEFLVEKGLATLPEIR